MIKFEYPGLLWLLIAVPALSLLFIFIQRSKRKKLNKAIEKHLQGSIIPLLSFGKQRFKFILVMIAFTAVVLAAANPQTASTIGNKERKGADIMICLDVSNSMLAQDLSPNRLERAKLAINQLITQLEGDRIGIVVFAGSAFNYLPLTSDYSTAKMFCDIIDTKLVDYQGTDINQALMTAAKGFGEKKAKNRSRTIILISDGEDLEQSSEDVAKEIAKEDIVINCIGIGSTQGTKIPVKVNGTETFKKDSQGNIVITKLDEATLKNIAAKTGGKYIKATNSTLGLDAILKSIDSLDKNSIGGMNFKDYRTVFYIPAIIALILLLVDTFIFNAKNRYINRKLFFGKD
ncbi:MAG: VWA domain-containing protein [Bacteroidales bacterium]|nr:VWA domain-containing protein [Bacteroidales bacterium]